MHSTSRLAGECSPQLLRGTRDHAEKFNDSFTMKAGMTYSVMTQVTEGLSPSSRTDDLNVLLTTESGVEHLNYAYYS